MTEKPHSPAENQEEIGEEKKTEAPALGSPPAEPASAPPAKEPQARRHWWTVFWVVSFLGLLLWYLVSDRLTPFTGNARVMAYIVPITAEVSGYATQIEVKKNQFVEAGTTLLQIDATRFEMALAAAEARLDQAYQDIRERRASVKAAEAKLESSKAVHGALTDFSDRVMEVKETGAIPEYQVAMTRSELARAEAGVANAQADLELAVERLGEEGENNATIRSARADLNQAKLDLSRTTIAAPVDGYVGTLKIAEGHYVQSGQPVMSLIASEQLWVEAYMTENNLGRIDVGDKVDLVFDIMPGRVFHGKVASIGEGVSSGKVVDHGNLPAVSSKAGWLRSPQRFPVIIKMTDPPLGKSEELDVKIYSQVDVLVYTGDHPLWNALARVWMWFMKWFAYAY